MMQQMREMGRKPLARLLLGALALAFVGWGIADYLVGGVGNAALKVNGEDISLSEVEQTYRQRTQMVSQMLGGQPTPEQLKELRLADTVLAESINRAVLRQEAKRLGLVASPAQLRQEISAIAAFQGPDGKFSLQKYEQAVTGAGMSTRRFETELANDLSVRQLTQLVQVGTVSGDALRPLIALENAKLTFETFTMTPTSAGTLPAPTEPQINAFYQQNPQLYSVPEKRSFSVLLVNPAELAANISVPEASLQKQYADNQQTYTLPETRKVRHILVETEAEAKRIAGEIRDEAGFAAAAATYSQDPGSKANGGELGSIKQTDVVPEFGKMAFSEPVGQVSPPVKSSFGWHLIWVSEITKARMPTFAELRPQLEADARQQAADEAFQELSRKIGDAVDGSSPDDATALAKIAEANGLKLGRVTLADAKTNAVPAEVVQAAFAAEGSEISQPLTLADGSTAYVQVTEKAPARLQPLADVRAEVTADVAKAQRAGALKARAQEIINTVRAPAGPTTLAAAAQSLGRSGTSAQTTVDVAGAGVESLPAWLRPVYINASALPAGQALGQPVQDGENLVLVRLVLRTLATPDAAALQAGAGAYHQQLQSNLEALLIGDLVRQADVEPNLPRLQQVFGADYTYTPPFQTGGRE